MAEYLGLQLGSKSIVEVVLRNKALRQMLEGAPGWRELITLGKIWHLEQMRAAGGGPLYDLIVVDAPATGHGVTFLDVPRVVHSAVRAGPLSRNAGRVEKLIRDDRRTLLLPVSLAEELPAQESNELVMRMRDEIGIAVDRIVINSVASPPFPVGCEDLDERLERLPAALDLRVLPAPRVMAQCTGYLRSRHQLNRIYVSVIGEQTGLPVVCLPHLAEGLQQPGALERLAELLVAEPGPAPRATDRTPVRTVAEPHA
jgi:anion-transporting  ArsA/GET3 family ATPase